MRPKNSPFAVPSRLNHAVPSRQALLAVGVMAALTAGVPAQLPLEHVVAGTFSDPGYPGAGGIYFIDPTTSAVTSVTGLPCEVIGNCAGSNASEGADLVLRVRATGQIVTNSWGNLSSPVSAYVLDLKGSAVTGYARYDLATISNYTGRGNAAAALLADDRVLLVMDPTNCVAPGPLAGALLGILDPSLPPTSPNAVSVVPVAPIPTGTVNAMAVDLELGVAYVPVWNGGVHTIYAIPVPGGGVPTAIATMAGIGLNCMTLEPDGKLLIGGSVGSVGRIWRVDPATGNVVAFPQNFGVGKRVNALRLDPISGDLFLVMPDNSVGRLSPRSPAGTVTLVTSGLPAGFGRVSGLDMFSSLEAYGAGSGTQPPARWNFGPNPGGAPTLGNAAFSLSNAGDAGALAVWVIGFNALNIPIATTPAVEILVAPAVTVFVPVNPAIGSALPLPIPMDPSFSGLQLYFQCAVTNGSSLTASSGLHVTIH